MYHNLLTMAEVDHLVKIGSQRVRLCSCWTTCAVVLALVITPSSGPNALGHTCSHPVDPRWLLPWAFTCHRIRNPTHFLFRPPLSNMQVTRSLVVDAKTGASKTDDIRTSYGAAFGYVTWAPTSTHLPHLI